MNGAGDTVDDYVDALLADVAGANAAPETPPPPAVVAQAAPAPATNAPTADAIATAAPAPARAQAPVTPTPMPARPAIAAADPPATERLATDGSRRWLRVSVGEDRYALALLRVQEVARPTPVVPLRGAAAAILGVMNLRGRVVPVLDLGLWLGRAPVVAGEANRIVVVERDDELLGLLVASVQDVVALGTVDIEPPLLGTDPGAILGVARAGGGLPTVLFDADALYAPATPQVGTGSAVKAGDPTRNAARP